MWTHGLSKLDGGGAWLASLLLISCSESAPLPSSPSGTGGQGEEGSIVNPGNPNLPQSVVRCGRSCTTDVEAARAALIANDYQKAFDLYQCADTPEAAFGAGLTRTLLALEGESADNLLADFGQPPLSATDLVGSDSILSRAMSRYSGSGDLSVTGSESLEIALDRVTYSLNADTPGTGLGELSASQVAGDSDASSPGGVRPRRPRCRQASALPSASPVKRRIPPASATIGSIGSISRSTSGRPRTGAVCPIPSPPGSVNPTAAASPSTRLPSPRAMASRSRYRTCFSIVRWTTGLVPHPSRLPRRHRVCWSE